MLGRVSVGEFDRMCKTFVKAIDAARRINKRPTFNALRARRIGMREWRTKDSKEVIGILEKRGDIVVDESKKTTAYFRPKKGTK